jgi:hypothetical protein
MSDKTDTARIEWLDANLSERFLVLHNLMYRRPGISVREAIDTVIETGPIVCGHSRDYHECGQGACTQCLCPGYVSAGRCVRGIPLSDVGVKE